MNYRTILLKLGHRLEKQHTPEAETLLKLIGRLSNAAIPNDVALAVEYDEGVVSEKRLLGSIENNTDPNDMVLEVLENLKNNLGPIDTEAEIKNANLNEIDTLIEEVKKLKQEQEKQNQQSLDNDPPPISPKFSR